MCSNAGRFVLHYIDGQIMCTDYNHTGNKPAHTHLLKKRNVLNVSELYKYDKGNNFCMFLAQQEIKICFFINRGCTEVVACVKSALVFLCLCLYLIQSHVCFHYKTVVFEVLYSIPFVNNKYQHYV